MSAPRIRVRPPHRHRGLLMLGAVVGLAAGLVLHPLARLGMAWLASNLPAAVVRRLIPTLALIAALLVPAAVALYMARCCQHRGAVFLSGVLVGGGQALGRWAWDLAAWPGPWQGDVQRLGRVVLAALACGGLSLVVRAVYVRMVSVLREQDGTLCVACGYDVSQGLSAACPECGTPRDTPMKPFGRIYRLAAWLDARAVRVAVVGVVLAALTAGLFAHVRWPFWRFARTFSSRSMDIVPLVPVGPGGGHCATAIRFLEDDVRQRALCVEMFRAAWGTAPHMLLRLGNAVRSPWPTPTANAYLFVEGVPAVHCALDPEQAAAVLARGLPASLVEAMLDAADRAAWRPGSLMAPGAGPTTIRLSAQAYLP